MKVAEIYNTFHRYKTLHTGNITSMPIAILMPHSSCNCRCKMCDIWKGNHTLKKLERSDVKVLLNSLKNLHTKQVLFSGGEALLHPSFFDFSKMIQDEGMYVSLLSTGLTIERNAEAIVKNVNELIVSLDGTKDLHDEIRGIPGAYDKLKAGIHAIKGIDAKFPVSGRTVIHRMNFKSWPGIIKSAIELRLDKISFLPADVSSEAFNRQLGWEEPKRNQIAIYGSELPVLEEIINNIISIYSAEIQSHFIAESPGKLFDIYKYYAALSGSGNFPFKRCNAPWVSAVIEPDGNVRPCFFHKVIGNIRNETLENIINGKHGTEFRKNLDMQRNDTCRRCVCSINLHPTNNPASR